MTLLLVEILALFCHQNIYSNYWYNTLEPTWKQK